MTNAETVESAALTLPRADRARLAHRLIASLRDDPAIEQAWPSEIRRRVEELRTGRVQPIRGEQVLAELRRELRR